MAETKSYKGGCHCGAVSYEVETDLAQVIECNCSHCSRKGFLLAFTPVSAFTLKTGEGALADYLFNKHAIRHRFCSSCGVQSFAEGKMPDGTETRAINVRCLEGVDLAALTITPVDGKSF